MDINAILRGLLDIGDLNESIEELSTALNRLKIQRARLSAEINTTVDDNGGVLVIGGNQHEVGDIVFGTWDCPASPTKFCIYDSMSTMGDDDCLYCHHPDERL